MSLLLDTQELFAFNIAKLILYLYDKGYEVTFGEALRTKEQSEIYAKQGKGSKFSNHQIRLAMDLMLFKDDVYLTQSEDYRSAGEYWKTLNPQNKWGGDFKLRDGNHFSMLWEGRA
jgi:hypothetical protein